MEGRRLGWGTAATRRRYIGAVLFLLLVATVQQQRHTMSSPLIPDFSIESHSSSSTSKPRRNEQDYCKELLSHEGGRWKHEYFPLNNDTLNSMSPDILLRREINWLVGNDSWPDVKLSKSDAPPLMYLSPMGNQGGKCGAEGFRPSLSTWIREESNNDGFNNGSFSRSILTNEKKQQQHNHDDDKITMGSSLRLMQRLAETNRTLCIAGDSIDFQIYDALRYNLIRHNSLQSEINISISESREIPVNFTNIGLPAYHKYWMTMDHIKETTATLRYDRGATRSSTFLFFKTFGWSPWNTMLMDSCDIVSLNLGLHYDARGQMKTNNYGSTFIDDFRAAITYLVDFVASEKNRTAVWRSPLPQHFDTIDGHYQKGVGCSFKQLQVSPREQMIQNYNKVTDICFSQFCRNQTQQSCGSSHEHICAVNRTSMDYRTVYKMLVDDNYTDTDRLERFQKGNSTVEGRILRWNIADLFDVPQWHVGGEDCSHFCFVPALYEAAFERLELLLASLG